MTAKGIFITGTDTDAGKTWFSCAVLSHLAQQGLRTVGMKPVASGASMVDGQLKSPDALALIDAANHVAEYSLMNPYCFEPPIAPHIAAAHAQQTIDIEHIQTCYTQLASDVDVVVVEGVGGWLVPLNEKQTIADLALALALPVIVVVGMRLGCINHTLLTFDVMRSQGVNVVGWIANQVDPDMLMFEENVHALSTRITAPLLDKIFFSNEKDQRPSLQFDIQTLLSL